MAPTDHSTSDVPVRDFERLIKKLPEIKGAKAGLQSRFRAITRRKLDSLLVQDYAWSGVYENPFNEHIALLVLALDKQETLKKATLSSNPRGALISAGERWSTKRWNGGYMGLFRMQDLIGLVVSLQRSILSIIIHHQSLSSLLEDVRRGSDDALFKAVRIDRSILTCPTVADRIAKAELLGEKRFFIRLRNALKGVSGKHMVALYDLRYALSLLRELGFKRLSDRQLEDLLVHQLKLYPNTFNARRNLRKQYAAAMKISTT